MPRSRRWTDLLPGVLALIGLSVCAIAVLVFAHVGGIRGRKMRLYATVGEARGLSAGSEVWLAGERIGVVSSVDFLPPASDTTERLILALDVLERLRPMIRRGALISIHAGGNLIGAPVVSIALGSPAQPPIAPGDTLRAPPETDLDSVRADFQGATTELPFILGNVRLLAAQLRVARGTLGALGLEGAPDIGPVGSNLSKLAAHVTSSRGIVGRLTRGGATVAFAREAVARADSIRALVADTTARHSIGRFRRDSTLLREVVAIRRQLDEVAEALALPRGTAGRLQRDSALVEEVRSARLALSALAADLRHNPLRYLAF